MRWATLAALAAVVIGVVPAYAGLDVRTDPREPIVRLEGEERPAAPGPGSPPSSADPAGVTPQQPSAPAYEPIIACREDADIGIYGCRNDQDPAAEPVDEERELTPGDVLRATREIGLPSLKVQIQPGEKTLVNVPTIFYAQPQPFERSVSLLGFDVDLVAAPVSYLWVHGDGTTATSTAPGRPYPNKDVTHRYRVPADDVQPRVDVTYQVRYRVDGGPWLTIGQTLLASGPVAELDVKEAAPIMTTPRV